MDKDPVEGNANEEARYLPGFPAKCSKCQAMQLVTGKILAYPRKKEAQWVILGKCTVGWIGIHIPIHKENVRYIPESVKAAALKIAGRA